MSAKKPIPTVDGPVPKKCPVCGKPSYSLGGIHPQCAVFRADAPRRMQLAAERKAKAEKAEKAAQRTWEKTCPKCDSRVPIRTGLCECGFDFIRKPK